MTPEEIRALRLSLGMTQAQMAARIGTTVTTISRWETDPPSKSHRKPTGLYAKALDDLQRKGK